MKRIVTTALAAALLAAVPAAAQAPKPLTVKQVRGDVKQQGRDTIGTLLSASVGTAPVYVGRCSVNGYRGTCTVTVTGTSTCTYVAHVHRIGAGDMVWGEGLKCS